MEERKEMTAKDILSAINNLHTDAEVLYSTAMAIEVAMFNGPFGMGTYEAAMSGLTDMAFWLKKKLGALSEIHPVNPQTPADLPKEEETVKDILNSMEL